jgi:hypothetical protein
MQVVSRDVIERVSLARVISSERRYRSVGDIPQSLRDSDNLTIRTLYITSDFYRRAEDIGGTAVM